MTELKRLCIHTITTKPWTLPEALEEYSQAGVAGVSVWQNAIEPFGPVKASKMLSQYPVEVVSYVRGGFFPALDSSMRQQAK